MNICYNVRQTEQDYNYLQDVTDITWTLREAD